MFLKRGPYAFSRHPMYLSELALWLGWAVFYGSLPVLVGFVVFGIVVSRLGPNEERALEATFGARYRSYANEVPRWFRIRSRPSGVSR
jgi:protein-S-isoprenylcysteine O-methyltransferase Ste14